MRFCLVLLGFACAFAADVPRRHVEEIRASRHQYSLQMGGTVDAANTRDPIVYSAWKQGFEPMRSVKIENTGDSDVVNPWILVNGKRNWRTTADIAAEALHAYGDPAGMTDAEKARAVWEFLRRHRFHATTGDFEVRDPVKMFNSYGFALCGDNAPVLLELWRAVGLKARRGFPIGHCVAEAWYEGGWHMLDGDESVIFLNRDNRTIASDQAVARDHDLSRRAYADEYLPALYNYDGTRSGDFPSHSDHSMDFTLRPGESIEWRYEQGGKHHYAPNPGLFLLPSNNLHQWGPNAWATLRNGKWTYTPRPDAGNVWKIRTPYVIVGGRIEAKAGEQTVFSVSWDGKIWKEVAHGSGEHSLDTLFPSPGSPHYEYFVKAEAKGGLDAITIENDLQMAPLAMPSLELGENKVTYTDQTTGPHAVRVSFEWTERSAPLPDSPKAALSPADGAQHEGTAISFAWAAVPGAADYHFELADEPRMRWALSPAFDLVTKQPGTRLAVPGLLNPGQTYYWHVRARSAEGVWGAWSRTWSFVPQAPGIPVRVRFEERDPGSWTLAWDAASTSRKPTRYRIYASNEKGFTVSDEPRETATGNQTSRGLFPGKKKVTFPATFLAETAEPHYTLNPHHAFYRVVAVDEKGTRSGSSEFVEGPRPWIYSEPETEARAGVPYRYEAKTVRSIGDLSYLDFGPGQSYQSAFWDADQPRFSLETEMPRCGNFPPRWLRIDPETGVLSGTPEPGEYQVNVRVEINGKVHVQSYPLKVR